MGGAHLNPGIRIFRVVGTEIRSGAEHNVEELPSIDGNLPKITELTMDAVAKLLKRPSRLVGGVFREVSEYPEFALNEAIVNTILHRDYTVNGFCTEIYLFDDRIQITSPGGLGQGVTIEEIKELKRIHSSRNSLIVRAMADLDYALGQGEGIPRMFSEMEDAFLPAPEITQGRWVTLAELAKLFGYKNKSNLAKHTNRLVEENQIVRRFPEKPSHPRQAYKSPSLFFNAEQTEISQQVLTSQPQAENRQRIEAPSEIHISSAKNK